MDKRTFIGLVEAGEPLIRQAIDAIREYHQAQDRGAAPADYQLKALGGPAGPVH